ncbi:hypothetical protein [Elizabethkingia anophelis]|uniref:hypothetical protein n=1 Tax=Elizabethkingia anophelis TaxID=1117645 RepID=UPI000BB48BFB|nr:hypothetical protein [Elizabethkingia anophelis]ATC39590.1 hypothetical protein EAAG1_006880 [Elizabethkingia anophelis Ag1]ATC43269.1 hypothetical protein CMV41_06880 [Elizabethkingia anophelis]ATC46945.1 hypothetical protein CMV40_06880 [Elizabethkingia anophelis]MCQ0429394.1 hypothetical protein [Elizabethkingia anophelis]
MADESIEIKFVINSGELMDEYKKLVSGSKDVDKATEDLKDKYAQVTAAQALGAKEANNLTNAINNVGKATKTVKVDSLVDTQNIAIQKEVINDLGKQLQQINNELAKPLPAGNKEQLINDSRRLKSELEQEKVALNALIASYGSGTPKFSIEGLTKENLQIQKQAVKDVETELKNLNKEISKTAPGEAQVKLIKEAERLKKELEAEKKALNELDSALKNLNSSQSSLQQNYRATINSMRELEHSGRKDEAMYKDLEKQAMQYKAAMAQVEAEQRLLVSGNVLQGYVQGLSMLTGGLSAVQGATALFGAENENLQRIMLKVQALMAITIGLQQIQQGLTTTSAFRIQVLARAKTMWAATNLQVAATLGITNAQAAILMATITGGLSIAIVAIIALFSQLAAKQKEVAEENKKLMAALADNVAEPMIAYRKLQIQWNELGNDLKAKEKFIHDNKDAFDKLGVKVRSVTDAENIMVKNSKVFIEAMMLRAEAAAHAQLAVEDFKKSLNSSADPDEKPTGGKIKGFVNNAWYAIFNRNLFDPLKTSNSTMYETESLKLKEKSNKHTEEEIKLLEKAGKLEEKAAIVRKGTLKPGSIDWLRDQIRQVEEQIGDAGEGTKELSALLAKKDALQKRLDAALGKKQKEKQQRQLAEVFPVGSIKDLERRVALYNEAIDKADKGMVKLQKLDKYGQSRDKNGKPYFTGEVVTDTEAIARRDKLEVELEEKKNAAKYKNFEEMLSDMEARWLKYFDYQEEYGTDAANRQFPVLKKQAKDFFDFLENQKSVFDNIVEGGGVLTEGQQKNLDLLNNKIKELRGDKSLLENTTRSIEVALEKIPLLADQIAFLDAEMEKAGQSGSNRSNGVYAMLAGKLVEKKQELTNMVTEFVNAHENLEKQKTNITSHYATLREKIESRKISQDEKDRLLAEAKRQKDLEIDAANGEAFAKTEIYTRLSENIVGITKRELNAKVKYLEEYLATAQNLTDTQKKQLENSLESAKKVSGKTDAEVYVNSLMERRNQLQAALNDKGGKSYEQIQQILRELIGVNNELEKMKAAPWAETAQWAGMIQSSFSELANSIGDSNEGLADTLSTISTLAGAVNDVAGGIAKSIMDGNPISAIGGVISGISKIFSIGKAARESERKAREEMKKYQDSIFQSGLDYQALLRKRLVDELKINDAYKARVTNIKEEMAANAKNKEAILRDQEAVLKRLLNSQTVTGMHTEKYGGFLGIGRKTRAVEELQKVGDLLGLNGYKEDPFAGLSDFMKRFMGIKNNPFANIFPPDTIAVSDELFDKLAKLNAEKPLTGDAKAAYEQLLKLKEEYGSIEALNRDLEKQLKDAVTGTTAQSLADSIKQGILSGKRQFSDFADDIENFLRQGIIAGMSAKVIEPQIQKLQDELAGFLGDGVLTEDEKRQFQEMYMKIATEAQQYLDLINQTGLNIGGTLGSANSLQGAYKAASQESIDLLSGQTGGMRMAQLETNQVLKAGAAQQMSQTSKMIEVLIDIEKNTRRTAENTEELYDINEGIQKVDKTLSSQYNQLKAAGLA